MIIGQMKCRLSRFACALCKRFIEFHEFFFVRSSLGRRLFLASIFLTLDYLCQSYFSFMGKTAHYRRYLLFESQFYAISSYIQHSCHFTAFITALHSQSKANAKNAERKWLKTRRTNGIIDIKSRNQLQNRLHKWLSGIFLSEEEMRDGKISRYLLEIATELSESSAANEQNDQRRNHIFMSIVPGDCYVFANTVAVVDVNR